VCAFFYCGKLILEFLLTTSEDHLSKLQSGQKILILNLEEGRERNKHRRIYNEHREGLYFVTFVLTFAGHTHTNFPKSLQGRHAAEKTIDIWKKLQSDKAEGIWLFASVKF
jgi:hypothetical protein